MKEKMKKIKKMKKEKKMMKKKEKFLKNIFIEEVVNENKIHFSKKVDQDVILLLILDIIVV